MMSTIRVLLSLVIAASVSFSSTAWSQKKKAPRAAASSKVEPVAGAKGAKKKPGPAKLGKDVPRLVDAEKEALADKKRDESVESLKKIIPRFDDGKPEKAELMFQLSELYWEKSKYLYRKEMTQFLEQEKKVEEARNRGEKIADARADHRESELYRSETMRLYESILKEYPGYDRKDEVLFSLGYNLYEVNKKDQAVKRYEELIRNYPRSKFVADTYVQLGNHYFDVANDLSRARAMFEKAYSSTVPKIKSYALYKLAWCDFNSGEHEQALKKLQDVVAFTRDQANSKQFTDLKNEALNDMVTMYVQLDRPDDAIGYFKANAGKKAQAKLIGKMAYGLAEAGHYANSTKTFQFLLKENPMQELAPEFQQSIIRNYEGLRQRDMVKAEVKRLAELYRPGSEWWQANGSKTSVLRDAFNISEEAMRTIVTDYHQEAQKTKQVETYRLARDIYKQYIDAFATSSDDNFVSDFAFNLKFYYAEILWALEEWEAAARQYVEVVAFKVPNRESAKEVSQESYRQSAAYNSILAYEKLVKIERGLMAKSDLKEGQKVDEQKKKGSVEKQKKVEKRTVAELKEQPLTKMEEALVSACDSYNQRYPNNKDEIDVRYQAAVVFYDRNRFVEAARRFGDIILKWPEEKRSQEAADLSMSVLEEKEEWLELNKLSRQFLANKKLAKPNTEFTKRTQGVVEGSQYKWVDEIIYKKDKDVGRAAEEFLKFVAEFPKSDNADRALTYAMVIFREGNKLDRGVEVGERVLKEYPQSPFEMKVRYSLANAYERMAGFAKSAEMYEAFIGAYDLAAGTKAVGYDRIKDTLKKATGAAKPSKEWKGDPKERESLVKEADAWVADAHFNAALWWEGVGQLDKAISAYQRYIVRFSDKKDVPDIAFNIALVFEKEKKWGEALKAYESFATTYARDSRVNSLKMYEAKYRIFLANRQLKNAAEVERLQKELIAAYGKLSADDKKNDRAMMAFAHARFLNLEPMWKQYLDIRFNKVATIKKDLSVKLKKIQEVEKAYTEVLAIGSGEYGIAALTRIGLAYADFAQNFLDSPDPKGLDEEQLEMYRSELENRAFPLEEKAIEALEKALSKSYELNVYNEWTLLAQEQINRYRPGTYGNVKEVPYRGADFVATSWVLKEAGAGETGGAAVPSTTASTQAPANAGSR